MPTISPGATSRSRRRSRPPCSPVTCRPASGDRSNVAPGADRASPCPNASLAEAAGPTMNSTICSSVTSLIGRSPTTRPSRSTVTRSAISRTAARSWEMKMTLDPDATTVRIRSNRNLTSSSGRKTVGSSSTSTDDVAPVRSRYCLQLLGRAGDGHQRLTDRRQLVDDRPRVDLHAVRVEQLGAPCGPRGRQWTRHREGATPSTVPPTRFSSTVSGRARPRSWCTKLRPSSAEAPGGIGSGTSVPSTVSRPPGSGSCTPARTLISVDLPLPFSPSSAWTSPWLTVRSTSPSARSCRTAA